MTFEEKLKELLVRHGLRPGQSQVVIDRVKAEGAHEAMDGRWGHQLEGYPPQVLDGLWMHTKREVLAYIDDVCPQAWFRPMFV